MFILHILILVVRQSIFPLKVQTFMGLEVLFRSINMHAKPCACVAFKNENGKHVYNRKKYKHMLWAMVRFL